MKKRILSCLMAMALCLSLLPMSALAVEISWPEINGTVSIDNVDYTYKGDFTSLSLDLTSSKYSGSCIFKAGNGYVLCNKNTNKVILHNAEITAFYALEVPSGAEVTVEGNNTLRATSSYALVCYTGGISVKGDGSLSAMTDDTGLFAYALNAGSGNVSVDITGAFKSGGIGAQSGTITVKSSDAVTITGLVNAGSNIAVEAGTNLSITNSANMAIKAWGSGTVSLTAKGGNITVSGGNNYNNNAINAGSSAITLDASGEIRVADYNGYPGVNGNSLNISGTIPEGSTLHSSCGVIVPEGKTLVNNGTLFSNSGTVTVAGTLICGTGSEIKNGNGTITPTATGAGTIQSAPVSVAKLDFRFDQPTSVTEYSITGGGTAKWEPADGNSPNKLTLNGVTMTGDYGDYYVVGVPANTEIILTGTNKITATNGNAICAQNAPLKITGEGSLEVVAPSTGGNYALSATSSIDVNITGALTVKGNIRADEGTLSLQSGDAISVCGSMYGKGNITATAGKSLNITNTSGTAVSTSSSCNEVSLAAQDGNLTVSGTGSSDAYGINGSWSKTALKLHASGNVSVTGTKYSVQGKTLELSGTIPEGSTLTADFTESLTVPAGKALINNGTIKLDKYPGAVTVSGTLTNNGSIVNSDNAPIQPNVTEGGVITVKAAMDFTGKDTNDTGEGYSWDSASKTLTLTDYNMTEPCNDTAIILPDGAKLVLNGENTLKSKNGTLIDAKGTLEISGTGSLTGSAGGEAALNAQGALTIMDCKLDLKNPSPWKTVICTNGNALTIADRADVSLHTAESSGWGIKTGPGGNFTLGSDAKLVIKGGTGILAEGASVKIAGTLDVSGCANLGANLLRVALNMEGSSITAPTKDKGGIYLYQNAAGTLTGQTDIKAFVGNFRVTSPNASIVNYYKVKKDDTLGLYAEGSTVSFTAEQKSGKAFSGWTATGVTLDNETNAEISFTMPGNDVTLSTAYVTLVSGITLDKTELALTVGDTQTLVATILPSDAANKSVSWSSDKPSVATVDENGKVTAVAEGTAKITVTTVDGKKTADCAVTVTAKSGGGGSTGGGSSSGGGGGGSSSSSKPSTSTGTTTRPDGTKVQTETRADGTKIQTETKKDGSTVKTTTNPNGSSVTEAKAADGSTGTVKTDKNGNTEAETKVSAKAVEDAKKSGEAVKAPVEVEATRNSDTAPTVKVELPKNSGDTKVEIPVSNVKPGTVAVLVHADGTEEIVKNSLPTEDGIQLTVDGNATVKIVDNSKDFIDTRNHWAKDAIDFVSARELVNGMNDSIYAPNNSTTRAQLWTILARQNDVDLTGGSIWYEKAQNWAKEKGISDGTNPNGTINRAQMVTMLWRAMGQPAPTAAATFTDVSADSYYAQAVAWAIENGITTGVGGGRFDPNSTCTRAQIATFLYRLYLSR